MMSTSIQHPLETKWTYGRSSHKERDPSRAFPSWPPNPALRSSLSWISLKSVCRHVLNHEHVRCEPMTVPIALPPVG